MPVDLSGEVKRFVVDHDNRVALRAMTRGDLPDVVAVAAAPSTSSAGGPPDERADRRADRRAKYGPSGSTG